jgi:hypothetical protein
MDLIKGAYRKLIKDSLTHIKYMFDLSYYQFHYFCMLYFKKYA